MDNTTTADAAPDSFTAGVNDILGAVNQLGVTAANIRDRFVRSGSGGQLAVPVSGAPANSIAASRSENLLGAGWTVPRTLLALGALALLIGVTVKLARG